MLTPTGNEFTGATGVRFGAHVESAVSVASGTAQTVSTPPGTIGVVDVRVTTPASTSSISEFDQYAYEDSTPVVQVTPVTATSIALSWIEPTNPDFTHVMIRRTIGAAPTVPPTTGTLIANITASTPTFADTSLLYGAQYSCAAFARHSIPSYAALATTRTMTSGGNAYAFAKHISRTISSNTIREPSCAGVSVIDTNTAVVAGVIIAVQSGTTPKSHGSAHVMDGSLPANRTAAPPVLLTSYCDDTVSGDAKN